MDWLIIIAVVVLVGGFLYFLYKKRLDSAWKGSLIDKQIVVVNSTNTDANGMSTDGSYNTYQLKFKTESGEVKMNVNEKFYNQCKVGDKFEKVKGESNPKKIS